MEVWFGLDSGFKERGMGGGGGGGRGENEGLAKICSILFVCFQFFFLFQRGCVKLSKMCPSAPGVLQDVGHSVCLSLSASWGGVQPLSEPPAGCAIKGCGHKKGKK